MLPNTCFLIKEQRLESFEIESFGHLYMAYWTHEPVTWDFTYCDGVLQLNKQMAPHVQVIGKCLPQPIWVLSYMSWYVQRILHHDAAHLIQGKLESWLAPFLDNLTLLMDFLSLATETTHKPQLTIDLKLVDLKKYSGTSEFHYWKNSQKNNNCAI